MPPRVTLLTLGGTIASDAVPGTPGVVPRSGAQELADELAPWLDGVQVEPHELRLLPSSSLQLADLLAVRAAVDVAAEAGVTGVVVSQGTDTLEETAFVLDVLDAAARVPVVVTGAMRDRSGPGSDGAANLLAAIDVALAPQSRRHGVLVVFADTVHAGRRVHKVSASHVDPFSSEPWGAIGLVHERQVHLALAPTPVPHLSVPTGPFPPVALVGTGTGDDLRLLAHLADLGYAGAVVEGLGGGHVPAAAVPHVRTAAAAMPVVLCSRAGVGPTLRHTYGYPGGEIDLLGSGMIWGGLLGGPKARLLLGMCLMAGLTRDALRERFTDIAAD